MRSHSRALVAVLLVCTGCLACRAQPDCPSTPVLAQAPHPSAVGPTGSDSPKPSNEAAEPKLTFLVHIDGQALPAVEGERFLAMGTFTNPQISIDVKPERTFQYAGVTFNYPQYFTFEANLDSEASNSWTLSGNDAKIMVFRFPVEVTVDVYAKGLAERLGPETKISRTSLRLGEKDYTGQRVRARMAGHGFIQDAFSLPSVGGRGRLLVLQDDAEGSTEGRMVQAMLARTFQLAP